MFAAWPASLGHTRLNPISLLFAQFSSEVCPLLIRKAGRYLLSIPLAFAPTPPGRIMVHPLHFPTPGDAREGNLAAQGLVFSSYVHDRIALTGSSTKTSPGTSMATTRVATAPSDSAFSASHDDLKQLWLSRQSLPSDWITHATARERTKRIAASQPVIGRTNISPSWALGNTERLFTLYPQELARNSSANQVYVATIGREQSAGNKLSYS